MIPIPKPGKDKSTPKGYRPVSLTCTLGKIKVMERIINRRIVWFLEKYQILCMEQSGFRPGRSTIDNTLKLQDDILKSFIRKEFVWAVFMDLVGAFDAVLNLYLLYKQRVSKGVCYVGSVTLSGTMSAWRVRSLRQRLPIEGSHKGVLLAQHYLIFICILSRKIVHIPIFLFMQMT